MGKYYVVEAKTYKELATKMAMYDVELLGGVHISQSNRITQTLIGKHSEAYTAHLVKVKEWQVANAGKAPKALPSPNDIGLVSEEDAATETVVLGVKGNIPAKKKVTKAAPKKAAKGKGKKVTTTEDGSVIEGHIPSDMR